MKKKNKGMDSVKSHIKNSIYWKDCCQVHYSGVILDQISIIGISHLLKKKVQSKKSYKKIIHTEKAFDKFTCSDFTLNQIPVIGITFLLGFPQEKFEKKNKDEDSLKNHIKISIYSNGLCQVQFSWMHTLSNFIGGHYPSPWISSETKKITLLF